MERQEAVECFTREAEPVLEEGKKLFYRELQEKTEQLSAVICDAIHEIRLETVRLEKEKMMFLHFSLLRVGLEKASTRFWRRRWMPGGIWIPNRRRLDFHWIFCFRCGRISAES